MLAYPKPSAPKKKKAQNNKRQTVPTICDHCGETAYCQTNEIFRGKNRQISIQYGFQNNLCLGCHEKVTNLRGEYWILKDEEWKQQAQKKFEETHTRAEFMALIGRNYLDEIIGGKNEGIQRV